MIWSIENCMYHLYNSLAPQARAVEPEHTFVSSARDIKCNQQRLDFAKRWRHITPRQSKFYKTPSAAFPNRKISSRDEHCTWIRLDSDYSQFFRSDPGCKSLQNLGFGPDFDLVDGNEMRHVCYEKAAFFKIFGVHLDLDFAFEKILDCGWTWLSFKKSELDLDRKNKNWHSAHLWSHLRCSEQVNRIPQEKLTRQLVGLRRGADPGERFGRSLLLKLMKITIHHDFLQSGKQHSRYKANLPSIVLSQLCCEVYFIPLTVVNTQRDSATPILLKLSP